MGPPFGAGHGVDLVDDHVLDRRQHLARGGGQHQVQRLRGGDEDVGRAAHQRPTVLLGGVTGAGGDRHRRHRAPGPLGGHGDAGQGRAQVALHVVGEGLERRHVEDPGARALLGHRLGEQAVERPQEGSQGLARSRGSQDQGVLTAADGGPALLLGRRRPVKGRREPLPRQGREAVERWHRRQSTTGVRQRGR